MSNKQQLTSVKVNRTLFEEFKIVSIRTKFSLQKLTDRALYLFVTDEDFRKLMLSQNNTNFTGSKY